RTRVVPILAHSLILLSLLGVIRRNRRSEPFQRNKSAKEKSLQTEAFDSKNQLPILLLFHFFLRVFAAEALDAASSVQQLLLAGKEGMAIGADFDVNIAFMSGAGGETMSTRAPHPYVGGCGRNSCLHGSRKLAAYHEIL